MTSFWELEKENSFLGFLEDEESKENAGTGIDNQENRMKRCPESPYGAIGSERKKFGGIKQTLNQQSVTGSITWPITTKRSVWSSDKRENVQNYHIQPRRLLMDETDSISAFSSGSLHGASSWFPGNGSNKISRETARVDPVYIQDKFKPPVSQRNAHISSFWGQQNQTYGQNPREPSSRTLDSSGDKLVQVKQQLKLQDSTQFLMNENKKASWESHPYIRIEPSQLLNSTPTQAKQQLNLQDPTQFLMNENKKAIWGSHPVFSEEPRPSQTLNSAPILAKQQLNRQDPTQFLMNENKKAIWGSHPVFSEEPRPSQTLNSAPILAKQQFIRQDPTQFLMNENKKAIWGSHPVFPEEPRPSQSLNSTPTRRITWPPSPKESPSSASSQEYRFEQHRLGKSNIEALGGLFGNGSSTSSMAKSASENDWAEQKFKKANQKIYPTTNIKDIERFKQRYGIEGSPRQAIFHPTRSGKYFQKFDE